MHVLYQYNYLFFFFSANQTNGIIWKKEYQFFEIKFQWYEQGMDFQKLTPIASTDLKLLYFLNLNYLKKSWDSMWNRKLFHIMLILICSQKILFFQNVVHVFHLFHLKLNCDVPKVSFSNCIDIKNGKK